VITLAYFIPPDLMGRRKDLVGVGSPLIGNKLHQAWKIVLAKFPLECRVPALNEKQKHHFASILFKFHNLLSIIIWVKIKSEKSKILENCNSKNCYRSDVQFSHHKCFFVFQTNFRLATLLWLSESEKELTSTDERIIWTKNVNLKITNNRLYEIRFLLNNFCTNTLIIFLWVYNTVCT
jgi:hypothetical protein